ncbi:hypothetical protein HYH02_005910 [Chlamydomonas schloesseri]|uniref:Uncharacterized protein n=1 Tax=Chlamydomonas schloesseri TaxID=2026947 RepID=A0A835WKX0_9CHLO|nr:hypothetical protein HYH02_005910 [Chlamydomonas schloesseri]|eukprot:KAG2449163.1 hypothetical protein HYH02_005910 [Chlamydomonas schloesseri]
MHAHPDQLEACVRAHAAWRTFDVTDRRQGLFTETERQLLDGGLDPDPLRALMQQMTGPRGPPQRENLQEPPLPPAQQQLRPHGHRQWHHDNAEDWRLTGRARPGPAAQAMQAQLGVGRAPVGQSAPAFHASADALARSHRDLLHHRPGGPHLLPNWCSAAAGTAAAVVAPFQGPSRGRDPFSDSSLHHSTADPAPRAAPRDDAMDLDGYGFGYLDRRGFPAGLGRSARACADFGGSRVGPYDSSPHMEHKDPLGAAAGCGARPEPSKRPRLEATAQAGGDATTQLMRLLRQQQQEQQQQQQQQQQEDDDDEEKQQHRMLAMLQEQHDQNDQQLQAILDRRLDERERQERLLRLQQLKRLEREERQRQEEVLAAYISRLQPELGALLQSRLRGEEGSAAAASAPRLSGPAAAALPLELLRGPAGLVLLRSRSEGDDGRLASSSPIVPRVPLLAPQPPPTFEMQQLRRASEHPSFQRHSTGGLEGRHAPQAHRQDRRRLQPPPRLLQPQEELQQASHEELGEPLQRSQLLEQLLLLQQRLLQASPPPPPPLEARARSARNDGGNSGAGFRAAGNKRGSDDAVRSQQQPAMQRSNSTAAAIAAPWDPREPAGVNALSGPGLAGGGSAGAGGSGAGRGASLGLQLAAASAFALCTAPPSGALLDPGDTGSTGSGAATAAAGGARGAAAAAAAALAEAPGGAVGGGASAAPALEFLDFAATAAADVPAGAAGGGGTAGDEDERGGPRTRRCAVCRVKRKGRCGTTSAPPTCLGRELVEPAAEDAAAANDGPGAAAGGKRGAAAAGGGRKGGRRRRGSAGSDEDADYHYKGPSVRARSMSASPDGHVPGAKTHLAGAASLGTGAGTAAGGGRSERWLSDPTGWASVGGAEADGSPRGSARPTTSAADGLNLLARLASLAEESPRSLLAAASGGAAAAVAATPAAPLQLQLPLPKLEPRSSLQQLQQLLAFELAAKGERAQGLHGADGFAAAEVQAAAPDEKQRRLPLDSALSVAAQLRPESSPPRTALHALPELERMLAAAASNGPADIGQRSPPSRVPSMLTAPDVDAIDGATVSNGAVGSCLPRAASGQPSMTASDAADAAAAEAAAAAATAAATGAAVNADAKAHVAMAGAGAGGSGSVVRCSAPATLAELQALLGSHVAAAMLEDQCQQQLLLLHQQQEPLTIEVNLCGKALMAQRERSSSPAAAAAADATEASASGRAAEAGSHVVCVRRGQHLVLRNGSLHARVVAERGATVQLEQLELCAAPPAAAAAAAAAGAAAAAVDVSGPSGGADAAAAPAVVLVQGPGSRAVLRDCRVLVAAAAPAAAAAAAAAAPPDNNAATVAAAAAEGEGGVVDESACCVLARAGGCAVLERCELSGAPNAGLSVEGPGSSAQATRTTARGCGLGFLASAGGILEAVSGCAAVSNGMGFLAFTAPPPLPPPAAADALAGSTGAAAAAAASNTTNASSPVVDSGGASATTSTSSDSAGSDRPAAAAADSVGPPAAQLLVGPGTAAAHNGAAGFGAVGRGSVLTAGAACRSLGNQGCGFLAAQGGRLTVGDESLAEGNDSGFAASGVGSVLVAGARCEAVGAAGCGFLAEEGGEVVAARGCVALGGAAHGFCARNGGRLVLSDGCQSECNAGRGFDDGSGASGGADAQGGAADDSVGGGVPAAAASGEGAPGAAGGGGRGHLELGVGCVSLGNLEPCAAAAVAAGLLRAPGAADDNAADVRAARAVLAAAGVLGMPARDATAVSTAGLFNAQGPL